MGLRRGKGEERFFAEMNSNQREGVSLWNMHFLPSPPCCWLGWSHCTRPKPTPPPLIGASFGGDQRHNHLATRLACRCCNIWWQPKCRPQRPRRCSQLLAGLGNNSALIFNPYMPCVCSNATAHSRTRWAQSRFRYAHFYQDEHGADAGGRAVEWYRG